MNIGDPTLFIGRLAITGLGVVLFWRLIVWIRESPVHPDPWDEDVAQKIAEPDVVEVCPHCSAEHPKNAWFCEHCGTAVGPYNNLMPYVNVFSIGEVLRTGAEGKFRRSPLILAGYILYSLTQYAFFMPVYLFFLFRNLKQAKTVTRVNGIEPPQ